MKFSDENIFNSFYQMNWWDIYDNSRIYSGLKKYRMYVEITPTNHTLLYIAILNEKLSRKVLYHFAIFAIINEILISKDYRIKSMYKTDFKISQCSFVKYFEDVS